MPPSIKRALVAINDSEAALHAFLEAIPLSRRMGSRLSAVSAAPAYCGDLALVGVRSFRRVFSEPIATVLDEALKIAVSERIGLDTFWVQGEPADGLITLTESQGCDLLIIGQAKRTCWNAWDSLTARLIRECPTDLLVIPQNRPLAPKRILVAQIEAWGGGAVQRAENLARLFGSQVHILKKAWTAADPGPSVSEPVIDPPGMSTLPMTVDTFYQTRQILEAIVRLGENQGGDMLILPFEKSVPVWDKLTGGRFLRLLRRSFLPTWFVRD